MQVREIMTTDPVCCAPATSLPEAAKMMVDNDCGAIPVLENKIPIGVITDRDIVCRLVANNINPLASTAADCMSTPVVTVTPEISLEECSRIMEEKRIRRVPVVDENGACCGIVALADIALRTQSDAAGKIVKEVSESTGSASAAAG